MNTFEIYSYYDTSVYARVLTAVGSFFADSNFIDLIQIGIAFGILFTAMTVFLGGRGSPMQMVSYFLGAALMFNLLFVPKSTVTIIDKSLLGGENGATTVQNVPTVVAYLAHLSTSAGLWADRIALQLFTPLPGLMEKERGLDDLGSVGTHMTRKIMLQTMMAKTTNSEYQRGITEYVRECVGYDLITHYKSIDDIKNAGDTWAALGDTNPALFVTIPVRNGSVVEYETMNCQQAHAKLGLLGQQVAQDAMKRQAGLAFPNIQETEMHTVYANILTKSMNGFMRDETSNAQKTFENMVVQNTILNSMGVLSSNPVATAKASLGVSAAATQKAELAKSFVYTITIVQLLAFAFFPIAIAMAIIAGPSGIRIIFTVIKVFFWLAILQFAQVIIDALILMNAQSSAKAVTAGFESGSINSMEAIGGIINGMEDQLQVALFASLGLTWAMMSTFGASVGGAMATALFSGAQTYNERTATDMAAEGRNSFGETSYMNARMGNESSYSYDVAPTVNQGPLTTMGRDGGEGRYWNNGSRVDFGANASKLSTFTAQQASETGEALKTEASKQEGVANNIAAKHIVNRGLEQAWNDAKGEGFTAAHSRAHEKMKQLAQQLSIKHGVNERDVEQWLVSMAPQMHGMGTGKKEDFAQDWSKAIESLRSGVDGQAYKDIVNFNKQVSSDKTYADKVVKNESDSDEMLRASELAANLNRTSSAISSSSLKGMNDLIAGLNEREGRQLEEWARQGNVERVGKFLESKMVDMTKFQGPTKLHDNVVVTHGNNVDGVLNTNPASLPNDPNAQTRKKIVDGKLATGEEYVDKKTEGTGSAIVNRVNLGKEIVDGKYGEMADPTAMVEQLSDENKKKAIMNFGHNNKVDQMSGKTNKGFGR